MKPLGAGEMAWWVYTCGDLNLIKAGVQICVFITSVPPFMGWGWRGEVEGTG